MVGDALSLPFADGAFERVFTGHFYDHLQPGERERFLAEARRVAGELVVADSALREGVEPVQWQERVLNDGSRHTVYKRYFTGEGLAEELGGGEVLLDGPWFVVVRVRGYERTSTAAGWSGSARVGGVIAARNSSPNRPPRPRGRRGSSHPPRCAVEVRGRR